MSMDYEPYHLKDNPFPQNGVVDVFSDDPRINGAIFFDGVVADELTSLRQRIEARTNMIYLAGLQFDRGVGKSAILSHVWRQINERPELFTAFLRCTESAPTNRPPGFCNAAIKQFHERGYIWWAFWRLMRRFSDETRSLTFTRESIETLCNAFPRPVDSLPLMLYTHVPDPGKLAKDVARWLQGTFKCSEHLSEALATAYLTKPNSFPNGLSGRTYDPIRSYGDVLTLLQSGGFDFGYVFLDQFEDSVMSASTGKMGELGLGIRRMLEASSGKASIIVTLHPDSEQKLNSNPAVQNLQSLAPIDENRYISLTAFDPAGTLAIPLAAEYIKRYREGTAPDELFPIDPEVVRYVCFLKRGLIRHILQQLHECINFGVTQGYKRVDMDLVLKNHSMTMGVEFREEKYEEFKRMLERC
jgi:hypothetical protein